MRRAARVSLALLAAAAGACGERGAAVPGATPALERSDAAAAWHSREDATCVEPAAALDGAGRAWAAWLAFRGAGRAWTPRLVAGPLDGAPAAADEGLDAPAAPALAGLAEGAYLVLEAVRDGRAGLFGRALAPAPGGARLGPLEEVTPPGAGRALLPSCAHVGGGAVEVVWQELRGARYALVWRRRAADGTWGQARVVAEGPGDQWRPRVASRGDGRLHVAWDAWSGDGFDVRYAELEGGRALRALDVAATADFEGYADLALDAEGRAWVAWERAAELGEAGGLRADRRLGLAAVAADGVRHAHLPDLRGDFPRVLCGPRGLVLTARAPGDPWPPPAAGEYAAFYGSWFTRALSFGRDGAARAVELADTDGDAEATEVLLPGADGAVRCLFAADLRTRRRPKPGAFQEPTEGPWRIGELALPAPAGFPALSPEPAPPLRAAPPRPAPRAPELDGRAPLLGDLHRHTMLSRCQGAQDGTLQDAYRYARGPAALDFVAVADHYQHLTPWSWWRSLRDVERFHAPGSLVVLPAVERALRTRAHVNEVWLDPREVPGDVIAFHRAPAERGPVPDEHTLVVPHMMGMESAPFAWSDFAPGYHGLVEVYQGLRGSYEGPGLPYEAEDRTVDASAVGPGLARGLDFGLIASSDHRSTSGAFAGVWSDGATRADVFAALRARRAFAATAPCAVDAHLGPLRMGETGRAAPGDELVVRAAGPAPVATVEVVKNGATLARAEGDGATELAVLSSRAWRPFDAPLVVRAEGARLAGARLRQPGETGAAVRLVGDAAEVTKGVPFCDVVLELERTTGAPAALLLERGATRARVELDALAPGRALRDVPGMPAVSVWRLGRPLERPDRPGEQPGERFAFADPARAPGDVYYARVAFADGNLAWTSPIRVEGEGGADGSGGD